MSTKIDITLIIPNPDQPRTVFDQAELEGLAQSIRENGLIQPIVVEEAAGQYILVDGERRWRAHKLLGLKTIDADVKPESNHGGLERLTKAVVANVQRESMGYVDEGRAYRRLVEELGSAEEVARKIGGSTATISSRMALLEFPDPVQKLYNLRLLAMDPRVIAVLKRLEPDVMVRVTARAATRGLTSKGLMRLIDLELKGKKVHTPRKRQAAPPPTPVEEDGHFSALNLINGKDLPAKIRTAALKTCRACALYPEASPTMCRDCPLPDFLRKVEC